MDPHPHTHGRQLIKGGLNTTTTTWDGSSSYSLENMDDHHIIFQHDQQQHHFLPASLDHHHSSLAWQISSSTSKYNNNKFPIPSSSAHHHQYQPSGLDDNYQQQYDDHHIILENNNIEDQAAGRDYDMVVAENDEEGYISGGEDEELSAMKEMMYKIAAMQPVEIDPCSIHKPKRRNVRISDDPQSVAARHRRERISEKMRILQRLVPGGTKMDTASMLDEAIRYVKFLKRQIKKHHLQHQNHHQLLVPTTTISSSLKAAAAGDDNHDHLTATAAAGIPGNINKQHQYHDQQECMGFVAAATVTNNNSRSPNADLVLPHHDQELGMSNKQLRIMENKNNLIVVHHTQNQQQMDVFSHIYHHHHGV